MPTCFYDLNQQDFYQQASNYNIQPFEPQITPNSPPATTESNANGPSSVLTSFSNILSFVGRKDIPEREPSPIQISVNHLLHSSGPAAATPIPLFPSIQSNCSSSSISPRLPLASVQPSVYSKQPTPLVTGKSFN